MFAPIAIVGRACLLPGAHSPAELWALVRAGQSAIGPAPEGRWRIEREVLCDAEDDARDRAWSDRGGYVRGFDAIFERDGFGVPAAALDGLDPLALWALHTAREALRDAGDAQPGAARPRTGAVFGNLSFPSSGMSAFAEATWYGDSAVPVDARNRFMSSGPAALLDAALGLGVPSFCLDAACASALYAIKLACERLQDGTADRMLAGAVNRADALFIHVGFTALKALSKTGQSRPFHIDADGLVPAEGAGFVVLKRLADAERDGDTIHGVIRGVGLSNDGRGRGLLAPSAEGQTRALRSAYAMSGVSPSAVGLIECHATGTPVGDVVELQSTAAVFADEADVPIGSLKSNLGHPVTAAGVAGLIKVLEAMRHGERPPSIGADTVLKQIADSPFRVLRAVEPWPADRPRIAGISAFGFGGNNAHLIVEEYRPMPCVLEDVPATPIAIVGIGMIAGPATGRTAVTDALLSGASLANADGEVRADVIQVALKGLRFPPTDLRQTLGQQLMLLAAAREAAADAGGLPTGARTSVLVGMEADPEVARYGARWRRGDAAVIGVLEAGGVVGTMPNVVANRLSSHFDATGPGYTISAGEASGSVALAIAMRALRAGEVDTVLVGAVDLSCEAVHQAARPGQPGDAAVALVLRRLEDADTRVYATLTSKTDAAQPFKSTDATFGRPFAATHLLRTALGAVALHHRVAPNDTPWLPGRSPQALQIEGFTLSAGTAAAATVGPRLHVFSGPDRAGVIAALKAGRQGNDGPARLAFVATAETLVARTEQALRSLQGTGWTAPGIHFQERPVQGDVAAVFTGAGAAYHGMGDGLLRAAPALADQLHSRFKGLDDAWAWAFDAERATQRPTDLEQLWGASALCQLHAELTLNVLGLRPDAAIGYSSGETNALFALGIWTDLDAMIADSIESDLFTKYLGGRFEAVGKAWQTDEVEWASWAVLAPLPVVRDAIGDATNLHVAIVHAPDDCVVAGDAAACAQLVDRIGRSRCVRLNYELAVHVPELNVVRAPWVALHSRSVSACPDVRIYGNARNVAYTPSSAACAEAILGQANRCLDFSATVEQAWADGIRIFVEHGPQGHCARWIRSVLGERDALVVSLDRKRRGVEATLDAVAALVAAGVPVDYRAFEALMTPNQPAPLAGPTIKLPAHPPPVQRPKAPAPQTNAPQTNAPQTQAQMAPFQTPDAPRTQRMAAPRLPTVASSAALDALPVPAATHVSASTLRPMAAPASAPVLSQAAPVATDLRVALLQQHVAALSAVQQAYVDQQTALHQQFLTLRGEASMAFATAVSQAAGVQSPIAAPSAAPVVVAHSTPPAVERSVPVTPPTPSQPVFVEPVRHPSPTPKRAAPQSSAPPAGHRQPSGPTFSRAQLETHASGRISDLFGPQFTAQDAHAVQVRMPQPPMLLADRVTGIAAEPASMGTGTIWTQTDVSADAWYLHAGRMPAGIMIESGQADLMLISWLGIDLINQGERAYRLLGCELTYHDELPRPGETLNYEIHVDGHANDGPIRLMFFHYDCRVDGALRLSVRAGQAGFFTAEELANSAGCLWSPEAQQIVADPRLDPPQVQCVRTAFDASAIQAFAAGRPWECFGPGFELTQTHTCTPRIADGRMLFLDAVTELAPRGGPWGRGYLRAETQVAANDWFFDGHFKNDPCMPGTLMLEGCLQTMAFFMTALGFTTTRDGWRFAPVSDEPFALRCRGQVTPKSQQLVYELFVEEVIAGPVPIVYADLLCTVDGLKAFHARRVGLRLVPSWPLEQSPVAVTPDTREVAVAPDGFRFDYTSLLACAWGRPSAAFGPMYARFDAPGRVARLPGPPYHFLSRVTRVDGPLGGMKSGTAVEVAYDVPPDAWYFEENGCRSMPFAVLLEAALQPCGWLASYVGSALTADHELCFRNLDGTGRLIAEVFPETGTLRTLSTLTSISATAGMIIESFEVQCFVGETLVYVMDTVFGFFPVEALQNQVGLPTTDAQHGLLTAPSTVEIDLTRRDGPWFEPRRAALAQPKLLMLDRVTGLWPSGGVHGKGRLRAEKTVDAAEWFFKAHFFQDPVQPGSLGIEAMLQLLQIYMLHADLDAGIARPRFEPIALDAAMTWKYRGQVIPTNGVINTTLDVVDAGRDARGAWALAEASLWVDGKRIYEATNIGMRIVEGPMDGGADTDPGVQLLDPGVDDWIGDHRPTYTVPALPMMSMVDLLAQGSEGPGVVIGLRDVRVAGWQLLDRARRVETRVEDGRVCLLLDGEQAASATVIRGDYADAPERLPSIDAPAEASPYATGALFHGPAFQVVDSHVITDAGSSAVLRAESGVPVGLLNPGLLDGATHAIPHDALHRWHPQVSASKVAYPAWIPAIDVYGPTPTQGTVQCEVRPDGVVGTADFPAHQIQLSTADGVWATLRLVEACFLKGPLGSAAPLERRAFLRDQVYVPGLALSSVGAAETRLSVEQIAATDWLPGTVEAIYGTVDLAEIARQEHIAAAHQLHPKTVVQTLPLTAFDLEAKQEGGSVTVTGDGHGRLDLTEVKDFWTAWFDRGRWPVEDLYYGLAERFLRRVVLKDPVGFEALRGRSVLYLANHQTGVESLLFSIIASGLTGVSTVTLAKEEHRTTWLGRLIKLCFEYPGVRDPEIITFFDRQNPKSLPKIIADLAAQMANPGRSVMVHIEGTRALSCRPTVQKMSGAFIDMAIGAGVPIVPVRFVGGLPSEPLQTRLEFPLGMGQQDIYFGEALTPEELQALPYGDRKARVIERINALGPSNAIEQPFAGDSAFAARVQAWVERTNVSPEDAVLACVLADVKHPTPGVRSMFSSDDFSELARGGGAVSEWLSALVMRLFGDTSGRHIESGLGQ